MNIPKKDIQTHIITCSDSDTASDLLPNDRAREMHMVRVRKLGQKTLVTNILGNTLIANSLPAGNNLALGYAKSEDRSRLYWINYNDQGYHGVYVLDMLTSAVTPVLRNITDTNGVDIMKLDKNYLINHIDIVGEKLIYWVDGLNKARKFNIDKALDKSDTGYGSVITEDFITAYKQCGTYAPGVVYFTDLTRTSNYLYAQQYKFCYRFHYDDGELSNWGDFSAVPLPPNESYLGQNSITFDNNCIKVTVETGNKLVTKIQIAVKINDLDWVSAVVLKKSELGISDASIYVYNFYNDGSYDSLEQDKVLRAYSFMPRSPFAQSFVKVAMTYTHADEGFETILIKAALAITFTPFYLPAGTTTQLNNPSFTKTTISIDEHGGIFNSWWTTVTHFIVGQDVKKGNVFYVHYFGGNGGGSGLNIIATLADDATTIAYKVKQYLLSIDAVGTGVISNEVTDGSGNVSWDYTIEAHEGKPAIDYDVSVTPVNYSSLLDNGLSINTIKQGSTVKYAVVYETDDNPTSLAYTTDALLAKTAFETDILPGETDAIGLQQVIHTLSILNRPPVWAKFWRLVRTNSYPDFIQMLIQQVNEVEVADEPTYLDMVVGSLFTYQKIHPDTILKYEFVRGDRLRLISKEDTNPPVLYAPSFETEVLGYSIDTEEFVNANIITDGTNEVTPSKAVDENYIGKNIVINDIERTIVGIDGAKYILDSPINGSGYGTPFIDLTFPNYKFVDRRGIIRIKKPVGYNIVALTKVEVYHPQKNTNDFLYQNFYDFQQKFPVINWGTATRAHGGNIQNQDGTSDSTLEGTPAIIQVTQGDAYVRNRAMPTNNANPNPQVVIDRICDPNFSDFYQSNLYSTGKVYPLDQGFGVVKFGSRTRFSNNYIEGTQINGLNDFNNTDRKDYNDNYGTVTLTRFRNGYLFLFKQLKTTWTPVGQKIVKDNNDSDILATSDTLLNELMYAEWEGGIGDNGESWIENGNSQYYASANSGAFIRVAQNGSTPISILYNYDKRSKELLAAVLKYNLRIHGGFDRLNGEALWSLKSFIQYLFNNPITAGDWQSVVNAYPAGTTWAVTQQPANSTATVVGDQIQITGTATLGNDFFKFRGTLPDASLTPVMNFCFTVIDNPNREVVYSADDASKYCVKEDGVNIGEQGYTVLLGEYTDDNSSNGLKMPNIQNISQQAIVPVGTTIYYHIYTDVTPTGGANGDIWYNKPADTLFKKVAGVWGLLTDRAINIFYAPPVQNLGDCPLELTLIMHVLEHADPYSDANLQVKNNGAIVADMFATEDRTVITSAGFTLSAEGYSDRPSTGSDPTKTMRVEKNGVEIYNETEDNNPGAPSLIWTETGEAGAVYEIFETADADPFAGDTTGILVVDIFGDATLNVIGYINTPGVTDPYQDPAYTGVNFVPALTPPEHCWVLASDLVAQPTLKWRFQFNLAQIQSVYPGETSIELIVSGRGASAGTIDGQYSQQNGGNMIMSGSPGSYLPSTAGATVLGLVPYSGKPVVAGADGSYGLGVGAVIMTFTYDVLAKTVTLTP